MSPSEFWHIENGYVAFYTENKNIMRSIKRYYSDRFDIMGEYFRYDKIIAIQYKAPDTAMRQIRSYIKKERFQQNKRKISCEG